MNTFFTSDTHFGHQRTLEFSRRPFADVASMDAALIANWNAIVQPGDTVYHLGDFGAQECLDYVSKLNGKIIFLPGNYETPEMIQVLAQSCEIIQPNTIIEVEGHAFNWSMNRMKQRQASSSSSGMSTNCRCSNAMD